MIYDSVNMAHLHDNGQVDRKKRDQSISTVVSFSKEVYYEARNGRTE